jgi:hypothetical protein
MPAIIKADEVFDLIQQVKAGAPAFCTNFFPVRGKLEGWIERGELTAEIHEGAVFFLKTDRDFKHLYFCAAEATALAREIGVAPCAKNERLALDLVGNEASLKEMVEVLESAGFRRYQRLERLARPGQPTLAPGNPEDPAVIPAEPGDRKAISELLERSFDRYADQLPAAHEIESAIRDRQIVLVKCEGELAALLFFETQGFSSTIRYWVVSEAFRARRLGSVLMRHYFAAHSAVKRFVLWVMGTNDDALRKYRHFGYAPDGLIDHVLVNGLLFQ